MTENTTFRSLFFRYWQPCALPAGNPVGEWPPRTPPTPSEFSSLRGYLGTSGGVPTPGEVSPGPPRPRRWNCGISGHFWHNVWASGLFSARNSRKWRKSAEKWSKMTTFRTKKWCFRGLQSHNKFLFCIVGLGRGSSKTVKLSNYWSEIHHFSGHFRGISDNSWSDVWASGLFSCPTWQKCPKSGVFGDIPQLDKSVNSIGDMVGLGRHKNITNSSEQNRTQK